MSDDEVIRLEVPRGLARLMLRLVNGEICDIEELFGECPELGLHEYYFLRLERLLQLRTILWQSSSRPVVTFAQSLGDSENGRYVFVREGEKKEGATE
jgi:hypothetical protein